MFEAVRIATRNQNIVSKEIVADFTKFVERIKEISDITQDALEDVDIPDDFLDPVRFILH